MKSPDRKICRNFFSRMFIALMVLAVVPGLSFAGSEDHPEHAMPAIHPPKDFEGLRQLVGTWEGTQQTPQGEMPAVVEYTLTSAGTVLIEKMAPGTEHEMISVYHGDQGRILMTHYCAFGNQPRMESAAGSGTGKFKFTYLDGTSIKSPNEPHMHQLTLTRKDKNHLVHEWVFYENGKPKNTVTFEFKRKS